MINKIIEFSVNNRYFVFLVAILLILVGLKSFETLSIDAVPDITNTQVQINTPVKGLVPEEIERMVTFPIEYAMNGIPNVETIRSISRFGISQVTVIFNDDADILKSRQLVSEKLLTIELPEGVTPKMGPISTGLGEIYHYSVEAKKPETDPEKRLLQLMELRSLQDWYIKPRLLNVKGVVEVNTIGGFEKQFFILPDIKKMAQYGIDFDTIESAIETANQNVGGGYIQQTGEQLLVRGVGLLQNIDQIRNVVVKRLSDYRVIRVKDISTVKLDKQIRTGAATVNGQESILGTTFMLLGENSRTVAIAVDDRLNEVRKDLPEWVELKTLYDRSHMVNATLGTVEHSLVVGSSLVMVILLLLLGNIRAAILTSLIIPIALLMTFILMKMMNVSGNLMSLGALDFGIIIDGAVIVIENCVHRLEIEGKKAGRELTRKEILKLVTDASIEIRSAAGFGELVIMVVFIPLFALTGVEGKMFGPMAKTFLMALASALLLSFTLVPAMAGTFLSGKTKDTKPILLRLSEKLFHPFLIKAIHHRRIVLGIGLSTIVAGAFFFSRLGSEFIPQLNEGDFSVQFIRPANVSITNSLDLQMMSDKIIRSFPQVENVFSRTGTAEVATDPMGVNISDVYVMLKKVDTWPKGPIQTKQQLIAAVQKKLELYVPAQALLISQPVEMRFNELLEGTRADVSAKIFGDDLDKLMSYSEQISKIVGTIEGAGEAESETRGKSPLIQYSPKIDVLANLGVTTRPVLDTINTAVGGREIGNIYEGVRRFPMVVRLSEQEREDIALIRQLPVGISENYTVPIEQVAKIDFVDTFTVVSRENSQRRVAVLINPETRDIETFVNTAIAKVEKAIKLPEGYFIEWGGSFKNLRQAKSRLAILVPMAMLIIIAMLFAAFRNPFQVALIFMCAPMALIGGVVSLNIFDMPFSISAGVGFIALSGIAVLNGVVIMSYFNHLYHEGHTPDEIPELGSMSRLRPVMMTALADIFGFLPMMFAHGLGAEVQKPLATVVVGGMLTATALTLLVLPALYRLFFKYMTPPPREASTSGGHH